MPEIIPFRPKHIIEITPQETLAAGAFVTPEQAVQLMQHDSFSALQDGRVIACAGLAMQWPGRYTAWAYFDTSATHSMTWFVRRVREFFDGLPTCRVEAAVAIDFEAGHRLARLCGFIPYAEPLERFMPDGTDAINYRRLIK